jgi:ATP-dependent helicase HrpB
MTASFDLARIGEGLQVTAALEDLTASARTGAMVVTAPPGTGKTTLVPPLLANLVEGRVLVTQPRRIAVRAAAHRLAQLDGHRIGEKVGFTVRGERRLDRDAAIEVLTPGVLLRRLLNDPALEGVGAVILDEVHERGVDEDLLLGMLADVRALREDLTLVAMSATVDTSALAALLGSEAAPAAVVDVPAVLYPLEVVHAEGPGPRLDACGTTPVFLDHLAAVTRRELAGAAGDALVFVPTARDVDQLVGRLRGGADGFEVLPLHGRLSSRDQDRVMGAADRGQDGDRGERRRVIVSTALAESSVTVPGVRLVIDSGLAREVRRDRKRDMTGLVTVSCPRSSAEQRAGRAARLGPGRAVRAYSPTEYARMPPSAPPEILSADLLDTALLLACWGTPGGDGLSLLTPPPSEPMAEAMAHLQELELTDIDHRPTESGRRVAALPVGVREARALLEGCREARDPAVVAEIVAALGGDQREGGADLTRLLQDLWGGRAADTSAWKRESERLTRIARDHPGPRAAGGDPAVTRADLPGIVTALARPEWIARERDDGVYLLASGTRAALPPGSSLRGRPWLAVREVQRAEGRIAAGTGAVIRLAAPLTQADALRIGNRLLREERTARIEDGQIRVRERRALGAITLRETPVPPGPDDIGPALRSHLRTERLDVLHWSENAISLRHRLALLHRELGNPWPAMDEDTLLADLDAWLGPELARAHGVDALRRIDVAASLRNLLPWPEADRALRFARAGLLPRSGRGRWGPPRGGREAAGGVRTGRDPAPRGRPGAGPVPPALPCATTARGHRRPRLLLGRSVPGRP